MSQAPPPPPGSPPPPPGSGAPPPPPGQPGFQPYAGPQTDGTAIGALCSAIASWIICPLIPAIVALVLARNSNQKIAASGGRLTGEQLNTIAKIVAWINIGFTVVVTVFVIVIVVIAASVDDDDDFDNDNDFGLGGALTVVRTGAVVVRGLAALAG